MSQTLKILLSSLILIGCVSNDNSSSKEKKASVKTEISSIKGKWVTEKNARGLYYHTLNISLSDSIIYVEDDATGAHKKNTTTVGPFVKKIQGCYLGDYKFELDKNGVLIYVPESKKVYWRGYEFERETNH